jgi:DNA uptake protein ComE-like DNA-binding protein
MAGHRYDLNAMTKEQLLLIPGIDEETADAIIAYRQERGKYNDIEELANAPEVRRYHIDYLRPWVHVS